MKTPLVECDAKAPNNDSPLAEICDSLHASLLGQSLVAKDKPRD
jgi:hypothetical protein